MQWRGGWNVSGTTMVRGLDQDFCPSSTRTVDDPRDSSGGSNNVKIDFNADGTAVLVGGTTTANSTGGQATSGSSPGGTTSSANVSISVSGTTSGASTGTNHTHGNGTHSRRVDSPTWVSLNGGEYFL